MKRSEILRLALASATEIEDPAARVVQMLQAAASLTADEQIAVAAAADEQAAGIEDEGSRLVLVEKVRQLRATGYVGRVSSAPSEAERDRRATEAAGKVGEMGSAADRVRLYAQLARMLPVDPPANPPTGGPGNPSGSPSGGAR